MKNKVLLVCAAILLLIFLTFGTYVWYLYFLRASSGYAVDSKKQFTQYEGLVLIDNGDAVYDTDAKSLHDDNLENVPDYKFQVVNTKNSTEDYNLYIEDLPLNLVNDGCTEDTLLSRKDLKYQLSLNGNIIKEGLMDTINDNILDSRTILAKETNYYTLKIYIHDEALDWFSKHYHYQIKLNR